MLDERITNTLLGQIYGWDRVSDANIPMLRETRAAGTAILAYPDRFPNADFDAITAQIEAIDEFLIRYEALIEQFA